MRVGDTVETPAGWVTVLSADHGNNQDGAVPWECRLSCVGEWGEPVLLLRSGGVLEIIRQGDI